MFKGGVIMDVTTAEQAKIAEEAGAVAVMALERVPAKAGGVARMASITKIREIMETVSIPVMAKVRIGHIAEARILEALGVDFIDESEVLTPADDKFHINKHEFHEFNVPFVCGARDLGEALRRIAEGAAMIRTKGEAGTGNIVEAVKHMRRVMDAIRKVSNMADEELVSYAKEIGAPVNLVKEVKKLKRLPVVNFAAGGVATPADAALMMMLGADGVFVGSGIFKSKDPVKMARSIVMAVTYWNDPEKLLEVSSDIGEAMPGLEVEQLDVRMQERGW